MALPKKKTSKARRNKRRAHWKLSAPEIVACPQCGDASIVVIMMRNRLSKKQNEKKTVRKGQFFSIDKMILLLQNKLKYSILVLIPGTNIRF
mgnify:CR=1 FL=1